MDTDLTDGQSVTVVMATMNEELAVRKVVADIRRELPKAEIMVVDSSTDNTAKIAKELGCVVQKQLPALGPDLALIAAFNATSRKIIVTLDCDNTYPPESIKQLLQFIELGYDMVSASRLEHRPKAMPFPNYLANRFFARLAWTICRVRTSDVHTGMRAYRSHLLSTFPFIKKNAALPVELQVGPASVGYRCAEIYIDYRPRIGESKLRKLIGAVWTIKRLWRWRWFANPRRKNFLRETMS